MRSSTGSYCSRNMPDQYILCVDGRRVERLHDAATKPNIRSLEDRHPPAIETPPYPIWEALRPFCRVLLAANRAVANTSQRSLVHAMITLGGRPLPHLPRGLNNRNMLINVWESSSFWGRCGAGGGSKTWIHLRCGGAAERPGTRQAPTNSGQRRARASDTRNEIWCLCGFTCCWSYTVVRDVAVIWGCPRGSRMHQYAMVVQRLCCETPAAPACTICELILCMWRWAYWGWLTRRYCALRDYGRINLQPHSFRIGFLTSK